MKEIPLDCPTQVADEEHVGRGIDPLELVQSGGKKTQPADNLCLEPFENLLEEIFGYAAMDWDLAIDGYLLVLTERAGQHGAKVLAARDQKTKGRVDNFAFDLELREKSESSGSPSEGRILLVMVSIET
jgi:hypothetical protein